MLKRSSWRCRVVLAALALTSNASFGQGYFRIDAFAGKGLTDENGPATNIIMRGISAVVADTKGGYYTADAANFKVRHVDASGNASTVLGTGIAGSPTPGVLGTRSRINSITSLALDGQGQLYFADSFSCVIGLIDKNGLVQPVAGTLQCGYSGDGGPVGSARINPFGLAVASDGTVYFSDPQTHRIRKVGTDGIITTILGNGGTVFASGENVPAAGQTVGVPYGLRIAPDGTLYVAEFGYRRVRKITPDGLIRTVAGTALSGDAGDGGMATSATFTNVLDIEVDTASNSLYIVDYGRHRVRVVNLGTGVISAYAGKAGTTIPGFSGDGGPADVAAFAFPVSVSVSGGTLLIAEEMNGRIRQVQNGTVKTVAGRWPNTADGPAVNVELGLLGQMTADANGNIYIADPLMGIVRKVDPSGNSTLFAGLGIDQRTSFGPPTLLGPTKSTPIRNLGAIAAGPNNTFYFADGTSVMRILADGTVRSFSIMLASIGSMVADPVRRVLYVSLPSLHQVLQLDLDAEVSGSARTVAGFSGRAGSSGDGGLAFSALLNSPAALALDAAGNLYIADRGNYKIRKVTTDGNIQTVAGSGTQATFGSDGLGASATNLSVVTGLAVDSKNNLFIAEGRFDIIRELEAVSNKIYWVAGLGLGGSFGDGLASRISLLYGAGPIVTDASGSVYFGTFEPRYRVLRPLPPLSGLSATGGGSQSGPVNIKLPTPLTVKVVNSAGPAPGVRVDFAVTAGTAMLDFSAGLTGDNGTTSVSVTLGATPGPVVVTATTSGLPPVTFNLTATAANPDRPTIKATSGVLTAGAYGGSPNISPGDWIEVYGTNFAAAALEWSGADFTGSAAPKILGGVSVTVDGIPAYVYFVNATQANVQVPDGITLGPVKVVVTTAKGSSDAYTVTAIARTPGILAPPAFKVGGIQYVAGILPDGSYTGPRNLIPGASIRPALGGETATFFGVGFGGTVPAFPAGTIVSGSPRLTNVVVRIGGVTANVTFAGLVTGAVGLYQINVVIPSGLTGDLPLTVQVDGVDLTQDLRLTVGTPGTAASVSMK